MCGTHSCNANVAAIWWIKMRGNLSRIRNRIWMKNDAGAFYHVYTNKFAKMGILNIHWLATSAQSRFHFVWNRHNRSHTYTRMRFIRGKTGEPRCESGRGCYLHTVFKWQESEMFVFRLFSFKKVLRSCVEGEYVSSTVGCSETEPLIRTIKWLYFTIYWICEIFKLYDGREMSKIGNFCVANISIYSYTRVCLYAVWLRGNLNVTFRQHIAVKMST